MINTINHRNIIRQRYIPLKMPPAIQHRHLKRKPPQTYSTLTTQGRLSQDNPPPTQVIHYF